ncbi:MAG: archease [Nostocaceae cyanobacterium]|nr:archease [Nostocaceae cyanobacterium]
MQTSDFMNTPGFQEVEHTADCAYRIWGQNLQELFTQATLGLYSLAGVEFVQPATNDEKVREIQLQAIDAESLLVAWLNELLYLYESEALVATKFDILHLEPTNLHVQFTLVPVRKWQKYIKAVTYNNLSICSTETGLETTLVLDV